MDTSENSPAKHYVGFIFKDFLKSFYLYKIIIDKWVLQMHNLKGFYFISFIVVGCLNIFKRVIIIFLFFNEGINQVQI